MEIRATSRVRLGAFELDRRAGELLQGQARVVLQEQPLQILLMMVEARGEIVTREEIKKRLWPNDTVVEFDNSIHTAIKKLRKALDDSADEPRYIQTVARRGYRLIVPVQLVEAEDSSGEESSVESAPGAVQQDYDASPESYPNALPKARLKVGHLTGRVVSHYRVLEVIGGGGMGLVYRAEDLKLGRAVALKFLPEEVGDDPKARERFEREAKAVSALNHFNICTVYDFDEYEGHPFIAMELLQGKTLRDHLADGRFRLIQPEGLGIAIQIASGLEAAHEKGIIHRDVKPANIFITEKNVAKILDFGVAKVLDAQSTEAHSINRALSGAPEQDVLKGLGFSRAASRYLPDEDGAPEGVLPPSSTTLTRPGMKLGTAGYMSPEQVRGEPLDARTDIFSFGLVLYEMTTGERAFAGSTMVDTNDAILHRTPRALREANVKVPVKLEAIVAKCLAKEREQRYQHASDLKAELQRLVPRARVSRSVWATIGAALLMLALGMWVANRRPEPAPEPKFTQLTSNFNENPIKAGAISPDNKYLAYADLEGVHLRDLKTGETRNLNSPSIDHHLVRFNEIDWWPDGSAVIGKDVTSPERQTQGADARGWLIPISGGPPRVLRENGEISAISPDGKSFLFNTNRGTFGYREVWQVDSSGEPKRLLLQSDKDSAVLLPIWLGENRLAYLAVDKSGARVESRDLSSGGPSTIAMTFQNQANASNLLSITMLRNGRIFYVLTEPGSNSLYCTLWEARMDPDNGKLMEQSRKLTSRTRSCMTVLSATADGQRIVFLEWAPEESIYLADLAADGTNISNPRRITPSEAYFLAAWTADSKDVVYRASHNGETGIFRQSIVDGRSEPIVASVPKPHMASGSSGTGNYVLNSTVPISSPDGKFFLYTVYTNYDEQSATPHRQVLRVPVSGGASELVLSADIYGRPGCSTAPHDLCAFSERSQDRTQIVFKSFDVFNGSSRHIATFPSEVKADYRWGLSPAADCIALVNNQQSTIDLLYLDGRPTQRITVKAYPNFDWLFWATDRKGFYVSTLADNGALLLYVDLHGKSHTIWKEKGGLGTYGIPSPDGRHIAMKGWTLATNLWMMENY